MVVKIINRIINEDKKKRKKNNQQNQQEGGKNNQQNNQREGGKNNQQNNKKNGGGKKNKQQKQKDGGNNKQQDGSKNNQDGGNNNQLYQLEGDGQKEQKKKLRNKRMPVILNTKSSRFTLQMDDPQKRKQVEKQQVVALVPIIKKVQLFSHLPSYKRSPSISQAIRTDDAIHPAILRLGFKFAERIITGSNARCLAMLTAFQTVIEEYKAPPDTNITIDIDSKFKILIQYLKDCRPLSIGMGNAVKSFKKSIGGTRNMNEKEAKEFLLAELKKYIRIKITVADNLIIEFGITKN